MVSHAGSQDDRTSQPSIGSVMGDRYRIESLIDEGAMGRVYLGEHIHMKKRVAIKLLRRELTRVPEVLARFEREALAAAHIEHPNVAGATDFGKLKDGSVYLVLEYVEGRTLRKELKAGRFDVARALRIGRQIASALSAAHELEIVHRDLKPENVMLLERGGQRDLVKVLDFGVAKVPIDMAQADTDTRRKSEDSLITKAGMVFGTPDYMAPEQALGQAVDARADLYSLGVMLFEMLTSVRPFRADHELGVLGQQLATEPPSFAQRVPGIELPASVENLVLRLLAREPSRRPSCASDVVQLLGAELAELGELVDSLPSGTELQSLRTDLDTPVQPTVAQPVPGFKGALPRRLSERVRSVLPKPLQGAPHWLVILMPAGALAAFAALLLYFSKPQQEAAPNAEVTEPIATGQNEEPRPPQQAVTDAQVESAVEAGELAVQALLERYPEDGRAHVAQARIAQKSSDEQAAVLSIKRGLELDGDVASSPQAARVLWWAAQKSKSSELALSLLKGPMKSRGADVMYDLATTPNVSASVALKARAWLKTRDFERASTPEAAIAAALLTASDCKVREGLIKRAENVGDERARVLLEVFAHGNGCSVGEQQPCNACLDKKVLKESVAAIRARQQKTVPIKGER